MDNNENKETIQETAVEPEVTFKTSTTVDIPSEYKPISMWGYFGYELLFSIPCIGFILLCVFAFGGTSNINLKNFARSYFCFLIILVILFAIFALLFGALGVGAGIGEGLGGVGTQATETVNPY